MNELVIMADEQAVTSTTSVAENFEREHHDVIKSVEKLKEDVGTFSDMFYHTKELDSYGRGRKVYLMNRDGFTLLAMGFTGRKATKFKLEYIKAFNRMENYINQPKVLSETEQLKASMKLSLETSEELGEIKSKVTTLENRFDNELTLTHGQATALNHAIKKRIEQLYHSGFMGSLETKRQMYSHIHSQLRRAFQSPTYREVKRTDFEESIKWVESWRPL